MKKFIFASILLLSLNALACEVIDDAGHKITLSQPAQRIISLAPDLSENLFAIGAGKQIVGVMLGSDYPSEAKKIPIVATYNSVDLEKIIVLKPDLIVVWGEGKLNAFLNKLSIPVYVNHPQRISDVPRVLERLGCLTGHLEQAHVLGEHFKKHYGMLQKKYESEKKLTVFYEVWHQPLMTISSTSWINDAITVCGGENSFAQLKLPAPVVNLEAVLAKNPDVIISTESNPIWQKKWAQWSEMTAVKKGNLFAIQGDKIERATLRMLDGVTQLCDALEQARGKSANL